MAASRPATKQKPCTWRLYTALARSFERSNRTGNLPLKSLKRIEPGPDLGLVGEADLGSAEGARNPLCRRQVPAHLDKVGPATGRPTGQIRQQPLHQRRSEGIGLDVGQVRRQCSGAEVVDGGLPGVRRAPQPGQNPSQAAAGVGQGSLGAVAEALEQLVPVEAGHLGLERGALLGPIDPRASAGWLRIIWPREHCRCRLRQPSKVATSS